MKRLILLLCLLLVLPMSACRKIRDLANIDINIPYSTEVTLPVFYDEGMPIPFGGFSGTIGPIALQTNSQEYMAQYHTRADMIRYVRLAQLSVKVLAPVGETVDFFDTVRVYISAPGQPEFLAAYHYGPPAASDSIALTCSEENLKNYFLSDVIYVKMNGHFNRVPAPGTRVGIYSVFNMVANPLY